MYICSHTHTHTQSEFLQCARHWAIYAFIKPYFTYKRKDQRGQKLTPSHSPEKRPKNYDNMISRPVDFYYRKI